MKAFVFEGMVRESLSIVRSLGRHGVIVDAGDPNPITPTRFSKYISRYYRYPDPEDKQNRLISWLVDHVKKHHYDMIFPLNDQTYEICTRFQDELLHFTNLAVNSFETFDLVRDKQKALTYALKKNIPVPKTWFPESIRDIDRILPDLPEYPVLLKPARSSGSRGIKIVHSKIELFESFKRLHNSYGKMLIQEYIPGKKIFDVPMIFNMKGEIRGALVSNRVRMFPVNGGPNVAGHGVINEPLKQMAIRLMESLGWKGVCLVEFKLDERDGIPKLMEVNPRFWGSTQIGISSGIDWPWMLFNSVVRGDCPKNFKYRTDKVVRWFVPGEIMHILTRKSLKGLWPDFFRFFSRNTEYYIFNKDDLMPIFGLFLVILTKIFDAKLLKYYVFRR